VEPAYLSALAALAGSAIGGFTSIAATWLAQQAQARAQQLSYDRNVRQELYRDFINEASKLHADSLVHDKINMADLVGMYALISRMRVISSPLVVRTADQVALTIVDTYSAPNRTIPELRDMLSKGLVLDPLRQFSEACREDLALLERLRPFPYSGAEASLRSRDSADAPNVAGLAGGRAPRS
jgi:hypothetical protein